MNTNKGLSTEFYEDFLSLKINEISILPYNERQKVADEIYEFLLGKGMSDLVAKRKMRLIGVSRGLIFRVKSLVH